VQKFGTAGLLALLVWGGSISGVASAPVIPEDLTGKTICWHNSSFGPSTTFFGEDGKYSTSGASILRGPDSEGTWAITPKGVKIDTDTRHFVDRMERLADGTFTSDISSDHLQSTGQYCK
jgi:hypothetical protein